MYLNFILNDKIETNLSENIVDLSSTTVEDDSDCVVIEKNLPQNFHCKPCFQYWDPNAQRAPNRCSTCHHFMGTPQHRNKSIHICPHHNGKRFVCSVKSNPQQNFDICPTGFAKAHNMDIKSQKKRKREENEFTPSNDLSAQLKRSGICDPAQRQHTLNNYVKILREKQQESTNVGKVTASQWYERFGVTNQQKNNKTNQ